MKPLKTMLIAVVIFTILGCSVFAALYFNQPVSPPLIQGVVLATPQPVEKFSLLDHSGKPFTNARLKGRWHIVSYGYTDGPDICPTTLSDLSKLERQLASDGEYTDLDVLFYTIDPQRDTVERLAQYVPYFSDDFVGLAPGEQYADALPFWRYVFFNAPKASKNTYIRGAKMYKALAKKAEGELKEAYLDTVLAINDVRIHCFGSSIKFEQSKAFDWYSYRSKGNDAFVYNLFDAVYKKHVAEKSENEADPTFLLFWAKSAVKADKNAKAIDAAEVLDVYEHITTIADFNLAAGTNAGKYKGAIDAVTAELKDKGYLEPAKIMELAEKKFRANPDDENTIAKAFNALKSSVKPGLLRLPFIPCIHVLGK